MKLQRESTSYDNREQCARCGEPLDADKLEWLELNFKTNRYDVPGFVPEAESQGCFAFGYACMKAVLKAGGKMKRIRSAA